MEKEHYSMGRNTKNVEEYRTGKVLLRILGSSGAQRPGRALTEPV